MTSGVYKITNNITGDFYIGSSKNIEKRWSKHRSPSVHKQRPNSKLYKAMASYGLDNFTFEIIEETDNLREREQYWIEQLKPSYNSRRAKGLDKDRIRQYHKEYHKEYYKEYYKEHIEENKARMKKYNNAHRAEINNYYQRLCLYEGKTLTLSALKSKLSKLGFSHPVQEAKKYLIVK